jgi:hypothetical protein
MQAENCQQGVSSMGWAIFVSRFMPGLPPSWLQRQECCERQSWLFREKLTKPTSSVERFDATLRQSGYPAMSGKIIDTSLAFALSSLNRCVRRAELSGSRR